MQTQLSLILIMLLVFVVVKPFAPRYIILLTLLVGIGMSFQLDLLKLDAVQLQLAMPLWTTPEFSLASVIGVALPLFVVTMASQNMPWYSGPTVLTALDGLQDLDEAQNLALVLPVQEVYKIGDKRYVLGRVEAGEVKPGQTIKVLPSGQTTIVKTVEKFQQADLASAKAGENIGLTTVDPLFIERGNVICQPGKEPMAKSEFSANLFWLHHEPLIKDELLIVKCATQESLGQVIEIKKRFNSSTMEVLEENANQLNFLEAGEVVIKVKQPLVLTKLSELAELGKFVLIKNDNIVAGGIISEL